MQINITKMGDGFVVTYNDETQEVYPKCDFETMKTWLGGLLVSSFSHDKDTVQLEIEVKSKVYNMSQAKPVAPKPYEV